jgi:hypothetical protein
LVARYASGQALECIVIIEGADHRTDDGGLVSELGQLRQVFANLDTGNFGGDGFELAADFFWSVHLQIEDVLVRWAARQENHDDCFVRAANAHL